MATAAPPPPGFVAADGILLLHQAVDPDSSVSHATELLLSAESAMRLSLVRYKQGIPVRIPESLIRAIQRAQATAIQSVDREIGCHPGLDSVRGADETRAFFEPFLASDETACAALARAASKTATKLHKKTACGAREVIDVQQLAILLKHVQRDSEHMRMAVAAAWAGYEEVFKTQGGKLCDAWETPRQVRDNPQFSVILQKVVHNVIPGPTQPLAPDDVFNRLQGFPADLPRGTKYLAQRASAAAGELPPVSDELFTLRSDAIARIVAGNVDVVFELVLNDDSDPSRFLSMWVRVPSRQRAKVIPRLNAMLYALRNRFVHGEQDSTITKQDPHVYGTDDDAFSNEDFQVVGVHMYNLYIPEEDPQRRRKLKFIYLLLQPGFLSCKRFDDESFPFDLSWANPVEYLNSLARKIVPREGGAAGAPLDDIRSDCHNVLELFRFSIVMALQFTEITVHAARTAEGGLVSDRLAALDSPEVQLPTPHEEWVA